MKKTQVKEATIKALEQMIRHADKGPSGFWTDAYEGCGNPEIFPEFEDGLKRGELVKKEHCLCPWNTAVMYGDGYGDINTGCYHSCSIGKARHLSVQQLKEVLARFKMRLENGDYDNPNHLESLLTENENRQIENCILAKQREREWDRESKRQKQLKRANALILKYPNKKEILTTYYGEDNWVNEDGGLIFFKPGSQKNVVGAEEMSYDEYLDVQFASLGHPYRSGFARGFFDNLFNFKGQIEKVNAKYICFKRIFISGMYSNGEIYEDKEDHVWMDKSGFEKFGEGDNISFGAEVYRYVKTGNGKRIDYGLRNPVGIQQIGEYELPSNDELIQQEIRQIICETCFLNEQCNGNYCTVKSKEKNLLEQEMFEIIKLEDV